MHLLSPTTGTLLAFFSLNCLGKNKSKSQSQVNIKCPWHRVKREWSMVNYLRVEVVFRQRKDFFLSLFVSNFTGKGQQMQLSSRVQLFVPLGHLLTDVTRGCNAFGSFQLQLGCITRQVHKAHAPQFTSCSPFAERSLMQIKFSSSRVRGYL